MSTLFAQKGEISGKVTDSTNDSPLIGANVVIERTNQGAATDAEGRYVIKQLDPGKYTIMVSYIGYQNFKENIIRFDLNKFGFLLFDYIFIFVSLFSFKILQ